MSRAALSLVATLVAACSPGGRDLGVEVKSDLVPGRELASVAIEIRASDAGGAVLREGNVLASAGDPYAGGVRVLDADAIPLGTLHVTVRGLDASGRLLAEYETAFTHDGPAVVTALLLRSCLHFDDCPDCATAADCAPMAECAQTLCLETRCFHPPDDERCPGDAFCHPARGCIGDASDAGTPDAGPEGCAPGTDDCDRDPRNGCETSVGSDAAHCGACDRPCGAGELCASGACRCGAGPGCSAPESCCDGACADLENDVGHCGACDRFCSGFGFDGCYGGRCGCGSGGVCPGGEQCCDGACFPRDDFEHCYSCTLSCDPARTDICDSSFGCLCSALAVAICPAGQRCCSTGCVTGACP